MSGTSPAVLLLVKHTKLMSNQFVISNYQNKAIWSKAIIEEISYLLLIVYVNLMQSDGANNHKKTLIDRAVDEWAGVMTGFLNTKNTPQARMTIKQRLEKKSIKYTPVIDQILGERLDNNRDNEIFYKYELYEIFLKEMLDNYNDRVCQRPEDGILGIMNFMSASQDLEVIREEIFNEKSVIMLSLQYDNIDITKNQNKKILENELYALGMALLIF